MIAIVQVRGQESPAVGLLLDQLGDRFPHSVTGLGIDTDQHRGVPLLYRLQSSGEFKAVGGVDTVVVIPGRNQGRWVDRPLFQVVVRGVCVEDLKRLAIVRRAVV